jgi:hypothetical protein
MLINIATLTFLNFTTLFISALTAASARPGANLYQQPIMQLIPARSQIGGRGLRCMPGPFDKKLYLNQGASRCFAC